MSIAGSYNRGYRSVEDALIKTAAARLEKRALEDTWLSDAIGQYYPGFDPRVNVPSGPTVGDMLGKAFSRAGDEFSYYAGKGWDAAKDLGAKAVDLVGDSWDAARGFVSSNPNLMIGGAAGAGGVGAGIGATLLGGVLAEKRKAAAAAAARKAMLNKALMLGGGAGLVGAGALAAALYNKNSGK